MAELTTYKVQAPDGSILTIDGPVGATDEQLIQVAAQHYANKPNPTGGFVENTLAGAGKALVDTARGVGQRVRELTTPRFADPNKDNPIADAVGLPSEATVAEARDRDAPLMRTGGGKVGNIVGNVATALPAVAAPGANTYRGAGMIGNLMGWIQPTASGESVDANQLLGTAAGVAGKYIGDKVSGGVGRLMDWMGKRGAAAAEANAVKDATLEASRKAGYVVPPAQANPNSAWNQLLEGVSGKVKTAQAASLKNQEVTNRLARSSIGLSDDAPLTGEALRSVRTTAGKAYEDIAQLGKLDVDGVFRSRIERLAQQQRALADEVPELADQGVLAIVNRMSKPDFEARSLVEMTKAFREKATKAFRAGDADVGRFYRGASQEIEDLIERNLLAGDSARFAIAKLQGQPYRGSEDLLGAFRAARETIAKAHTIEGALNEAGNVVGSKLAAQLQKGKPLSGGLETAGTFAANFKKAAQTPEQMGSVASLSPLDYLASMGMLGMDMGAASAVGLAARPAVRSVILSKPYQSVMTTPNYGPGNSMKLLSSMVDNEFVRRLAPAAAASAAVSK